MSGAPIGQRPARRIPPRLLRRVILSALLGAALGTAAWFLGMDAAHAAGLAAAAFAFAACLSALGDAANVVWSLPAREPRPGARRDVAQLGWALGSRGGRASPEGVRRLRSVAEHALALHGLDVEDRAADAELDRLLGREVVAMLRRGSSAEPRAALVGTALDRLEALERAASGRGQESAERPSEGLGDRPTGALTDRVTSPPVAARTPPTTPPTTPPPTTPPEEASRAR